MGAIVGAQVVDLADVVGHPAFPSTMEALVSRPRGTVMDAARAALERTDEVEACTVPDARLLAPILPPSLGEDDHRWLAGPGDEISCPPGNGDVRFDLELAAVIFRPTKGRLRKSQAADCVFGYTLMSYWSHEEAFAAALGPCIVTADEFDPDTEVVASVNGKEWSRGNLTEAESSFAEQIVAAAKAGELLPGEVFGSGTLGLRKRTAKPPKPGATVEIDAAGIGVLRNTVGARVRSRAAS